MNEVTLHRGRSPHLNIIDAYVNGQHLTEAVVGPFSAPQAPTHITHEVRWPHFIHTNRFNGVLPLMRRSYRAPFCTRLAPYTDLCSKPEFQTACATRFITYHASGTFLVTFSYGWLTLFQINPRSRAPAEVSMDGQETRILLPGESISVEASCYPVPCINRSAPARNGSDGVEDDWLRDINTLLQFNVSFKNKNPSDM